SFSLSASACSSVIGFFLLYAPAAIAHARENNTAPDARRLLLNFHLFFAYAVIVPNTRTCRVSFTDTQGSARRPGPRRVPVRSCGARLSGIPAMRLHERLHTGSGDTADSNGRSAPERPRTSRGETHKVVGE